MNASRHPKLRTQREKMKATILVNRRKVASRVVGVIASPVALVRATRLRRPPDLFELRLDALRDSLGEVERMIPQLRAPLILSARHPAEGGVRQSSSIRFRKAGTPLRRASALFVSSSIAAFSDDITNTLPRAPRAGK